MPTNTHALVRHRTIDNCLKRGQEKTIGELIEKCGNALFEFDGLEEMPSKRTIEKDIHDMQTAELYSAPIEFKKVDGGVWHNGNKYGGYYYYSDPKFSITNNPLIEKDVQLLQDALNILKQFRGFQHFEGMEALLLKLEKQTSLYSSQNDGVVDFEKNEIVQGGEYLQPIYEAITQKYPLKITYKPFTENSSERFVHPYQLKEYKNRWFLVCYDETRQNISTLALDRMKNVEREFDVYQPDDRDWQQFFADVIGITVPLGKEKETIRLQFVKQRAPYIITKPLHRSQRIISDDHNGLVVELQLIVNQELITTLLEFGDHVSVLAPDHLAETITNRLETALSFYKKNPSI